MTSPVKFILGDSPALSDQINLSFVNIRNIGILAILLSTVNLQPTALYVLNLAMIIQIALHNYGGFPIVFYRAALPTSLNMR